MTGRVRHGFSDSVEWGQGVQDDETDALDRLEAALERIATARPAVALEPVLAPALAPVLAPALAPVLATRIDTLIGQLRDALAHPPL